MAEPTGAINISKAMFQVDENLSSQPKLSNQLHMNLSDSKNIASWNSLPEHQGFENQMPAYLNQVRLSNYYQDTPWPVLQFSQEFGLSPMGGQLNPNLPPGRRPGNTLKTPPVAMGMAKNFMTGTEMAVRQPNVQNNIHPVVNNGIAVPSFMKGMFK